MPTEKTQFRFDFVQEIANVDEKSGKFTARLIPHPDRYERRIVNGEECYLDKFDNVIIPIRLIKQMASWMVGQPIYSSRPKIESGDKYVKSRMQEIGFLDTSKPDFKPVDLSEEFLEKIQSGKMRFAIIAIDLKGSTAMSQKLPPEENAKIISLFQKEMTLIVHNFNGYVLKYLGDGMIAYFPEPNFIGMNDNAIDCAVTMKKMITFGINMVLKEKGFPQLSFRIGIDSGEAVITDMGAPGIKIHKDLIGETINLAAKIQGFCQENQILLGESTVLSLHTFWRKILKSLDKSATWEYKEKKTGQTYQLYYLPESW